jgi:hypothetical protein
MSSLFLTAAIGLGGFLYLCYSRTPYLENSGKQTDNPVVDRTTFVSQYSDPKDTWSDPNNLMTNPQMIKEIKRESGPYGVPRVYWTGPGNSKLVNYGDNYNAI